MKTLYIGCSYCNGNGEIFSLDGAHSSICPYCSNGVESEVNFNDVAKKKLDDLLGQGFQINGVSIQKSTDDYIRRGFVTAGGMVCWWYSDEERATWEANRKKFKDSK